MSEDAQTDILRKVAEQQIEFLNLQFIDILGIVKTVTIPVQQFEYALVNGVWFDGSSIEGFARIAESDMYLVPDLNTYRKLPWSEDGVIMASLICNVYTPDGRPFAGDPRYVLQKMLQQTAEMGYCYQVGPELEFFLLQINHDGYVDPRIPHDNAGYFDTSTSKATHILNRMVKALQDMHIDVDASHHEVSPGQHEVDLRYSDALKAADNSIMSRVVIKTIAQQQGLHATFMPKPVAGINGNGMHVHQNLASLESGENVFYDAEDHYNLSKLARYFIAGLLDHAHGMIAVLAPLVNSYKRLVPGFEAPVYLSWGRTNRSALVRVPRTSEARHQAIRVELRCPDPTCNPYLAFAAMLGAGLDGIKRKLPLGEAAEEDLFHVDPRALGLEVLPSSLGEAIEALKEDEVIQAALGPHVYERFLDAKEQEWSEYRNYVSEWEVERYLSVF